MPEIFFEAFELAAPEVVSASAPIFDAAAFEGLSASQLASMAATNPAVAQQIAAQQMAQGVASGGIGAAEGSAAQLASQQAKAIEAANSGINSVMTPQQQAYMQASNAGLSPGITQGTVPLTNPYNYQGIQSTMLDSGARSPVDLSRSVLGNANVPTNLPANPDFMQAANNVPSSITNPNLPQPGPVLDNGGIRPPLSGLEKGWQSATDWMDKHPYYTAAGAYIGANKLGLLNPNQAKFGDTGGSYTGPLSKYSMSPDFKGSFADPAKYQYTPRYAEGGIMVGGDPTPTGQPQYAYGGGPVPTQFAEGGIANYDFGGMVGNALNTVGNGINTVGNGINNVVGGVGNTLADMGSGVGHMFKGADAGGMQAASNMMGPLTADQVAKKYSANTLAQNNAIPQQPQYTPQYAEGGVAHFAKGNLADSLNYYTDMLGGIREKQIAEAQTPAGGRSMLSQDVIRDTDPDTAYLSAPEAAAVRMGKVNARANMQGLTLPRPKPIGRINLKPQGVQQAAASGSSLDPEVNAATGGIMGANLGGYAAGGNPRLLKGPGDGMSDDIPATIANKQPARLADGEFVVPADVVSHLGNGSTEAGAKKLHSMMDSVRKARTGNSKQGKQINPNKYLPK